VSFSSLTPGTLVVLSLHTPREKYWGALEAILPAGVVVRGLALDVFEDWVRQEQRDAQRMLGPTSVFFPMGRVERLEADETVGPVIGFGERFAAAVGRSALIALGGAAYCRSSSKGSSARGASGARKVGTRR
jgi:hypothetical protein